MTHRKRYTNDFRAATQSGRIFYAPLTSSLTALGAGSTTPTFSRASVATEFGYDSGAVTGDPMTLLDIDSGEARFRGARRVSSGVWSIFFSDGNPIPETSLWGFRREVSRTNKIANNTMAGAVAGSPGTLPTGWVSSVGATQTIVGTGTENGVAYIDIQLSGVTSTTGSSISFNTGVTAAINNVWSGSCFLKIVGGSSTNVSGALIRVRQNDSGGAGIGFINFTSSAIPPSSGNLIDTRIGGGATLTAVGTASITPQVLVSHTSGVPIDITLRIGLPQLELGAVPTTPIKTSVAELTRAADVLTYPSANNANVSNGTIAVQAITEWPTSGVTASNRIAVDIARSTSTAQDILIGMANINSKAGTATITNGTTQYNVAATPNIAANTPVKVALGWELNNSRAAFNGTFAALDTVCTMPSLLTTIYVGNDDSGLGDLNGCVKNLAIYNARKPDATILQFSR